MSDYQGTIIEESLEDKAVLKNIKILSTEVETVTETHQTPWIKQWTLHKVEIPESEAQKIAEELARSLDPDHAHAWYADFKNDVHHYYIFRNKIFFIEREDKKQYEEVRQYGLKLGISGYQLPNSIGLPEDVLGPFLKEAHRNTYANKSAATAPSTRLGSTDYHFEKDGLTYHDTYFDLPESGGRTFIGGEIVYKDKGPVWGMNYYGRILDENLNEKEVYDFLRRALMQECEGIMQLRGPAEFQEGDWIYRFSSTGDLSNFSGQEEISLKGKIVYRCLVHGGFVQ